MRSRNSLMRERQEMGSYHEAATISALPFKIAHNTSDIANIVQEILNIKTNNHDANVSLLENKIDILVYKLYGLNYEEVLIVDPQTQITREEYESK